MSETHHNHITYQNFRAGLLEYLGHDIKKLTSEQITALIKPFETDWWFCGGSDTDPFSEIPCPHPLKEWEKLWIHYHGTRPMPKSTNECICGQKGIRYNIYITDGTRVITIGCICLRQFLPKIAESISKKYCDECMTPHKNRKDNYCKDCRLLRKEREAMKKKEEEEAEEKERQERIRLAMENERAQRERLMKVCKCGKEKKPQFPSCWSCHQASIESMSEMERKKAFCSCGKKKKPEYRQCYTCNSKSSSGVQVEHSFNFLDSLKIGRKGQNSGN